MRPVWSLQYLRAFAAIGVVVFHVLAGTSHPFPLGAAGVDIFFVLSGFLMFALTSRRPVTPGRFLLDRITRIVPLYWIATLIIFAAAWSTRDGIYLVGRSPTLLIQSLFFLPRGAAAADGIAYPTLFVGWTLDAEMFFYVLFALALMLTGSPSRRIVLMSVVFGGLVAAGIVLRPADRTLSSDTNPIILEFLEGAWIGALFAARDAGQASGRTLALGLAAVLAVPFVLHGLPRSSCAFLAVALVVSALVLERAAPVPKIAPLRFLGDASYSIYLFQIFGFRLADFALIHAGSALRLPLGPVVRSVAEFGLAVGLGCLVHVVIERPLLVETRRAIGRIAQVPIGIAKTS